MNRNYTTWIVFLYLVAALNSWAATDEKKMMDGYIIFGQSNANGRSYHSELKNEALRHNFGGENSAYLYAYRERSYQNGSQPEDIPLGVMQPDSRDRIGVEVTLGRYLAAHSPRPVFLAKFCSGGTSIKNFLPDENNLFDPMVQYLNEQQKAAEELGYDVQWKGAFVITGESDSSEASATVFRERFLVVQAALEEELGLKSLPIVYSLLRGNWVDTPASKYSRHNDPAAFINASMTDLAMTDSSIRVTPPNTDLKTRFENGDSKGDGIHYSSNSYARLGVRLYSAAILNHGPGIDLNANGVCDIWEAKYSVNNPNSPEATRDRKLSAKPIDSDVDGVSDWAENQLNGFDPENNDSFEIGEPFSDLPILLSRLEGTKMRRSEIAIVWEPDSPNHTSGLLGDVAVDWSGPQHESTATGGAVVTANNQGGNPIEHVVTFEKQQSPLFLTTWGIAKGKRLKFDRPFSVIENPNNATVESQMIIGSLTSDSRVTLSFEEPGEILTITAQGDDATFFSFLTEVEATAKPLQWRD